MLVIEYYEDTRKPEVIAFQNEEQLLDGPLIEYDEEGSLKSYEMYQDGEQVSETGEDINAFARAIYAAVTSHALPPSRLTTLVRNPRTPRNI